MDITQLLIEYKSIIGTILGSVTALIVTHSLRHFGKVRFYLNSWECSYYTVTDIGDYVKTDNIINAVSCELRVSLDLYNGSDIPKNLRDAHIELYSKSNKRSFSFRNNNSIEEIIEGGDTQIIKIIYLPAKEMININLYCIFRDESLEYVKKVDAVYFVASTENNRIYKKRIADKICR